MPDVTVLFDGGCNLCRGSAERVKRFDSAQRIEFRCLAMEDIRSLPEGEMFDGVLSNFGAVNCVPDLKALVRGYSYAVVPITWTNRAAGVSKLKIKEMGSRYLFIVLYLWLEKHLARGDYHRTVAVPNEEKVPNINA